MDERGGPSVGGGECNLCVQYVLRLLEACPGLGFVMAGVWALKGRSGDALRSFIWSLLGFVPVLNVVRWTAITVRYVKKRKKVWKLRKKENEDLLFAQPNSSSAVMDTSCWMNDQRIQERSLYQLAVPGSHNSGAHSCPGLNTYYECWTVCQHASILSQLQKGIRFFDLRITDCTEWSAKNRSRVKRVPQAVDFGDERLWVSHTYLCAPMRQFLTQLSRFVHTERSKGEVITVQVAGDFASGQLSADAWRAMHSLFMDTGFSESDFLLRDDIGKPLSVVTGRGRRVLLLTQACPVSDAVGGFPHFIETHGLLFGSWGVTRSNNSEDLEKKMCSWVDDNKHRFGRYLFKAQCEVTPDVNSVVHGLLMVKCNGEVHFNLQHAAEYANEMLLKILRTQWRGALVNCYITHDFVRSDICQAIINLNFQSVYQPPPHLNNHARHPPALLEI